MEFNMKLQVLREARKMKKVDVAKAAGISESFYNEIESGKKKCTIDTLDALCKALNVTLSEFFKDETENMTVPPELEQYGLEEIRIRKNSKVSTKDLKHALQVIADAMKDNQD